MVRDDCGTGRPCVLLRSRTSPQWWLSNRHSTAQQAPVILWNVSITVFVLWNSSRDGKNETAYWGVRCAGGWATSLTLGCRIWFFVLFVSVNHSKYTEEKSSISSRSCLTWLFLRKLLDSVGAGPLSSESVRNVTSQSRVHGPVEATFNQVGGHQTSSRVG